MDTYSFLRELADSWVLLAMTCFSWHDRVVVSPGSSKPTGHRDIPFRNETVPRPRTRRTENEPKKPRY